MTNEMLAVLLQKYKDKLSDAILKVEESLPEDLQEEVKPLLGPKYRYFPQLESLRALEDELSYDIALLTSDKIVMSGGDR